MKYSESPLGTKTDLAPENFISVDRDKLVFGMRNNAALLEIVAKCQCIESDIKAVVNDDASGAGLIVLSERKLIRLGSAKKQQMLRLLKHAGAIREDVLYYSDDIDFDERIRRDVFKSRFEVEYQAA